MSDFKAVTVLNCKHFNGEKPCEFQENCAEDCRFFEEFGSTILIIKLGAMGDVLRTTPLLAKIKKEFPKSFITWITEPESIPLLSNNLLIDRLLKYNWENSLYLQAQEFDLVICLDKERRAVSLAELVKAKKKAGYGLTADGNLKAFDVNSSYALQLGVSDRLKFKDNKKTYQEIIFEQAGYQYENEEYVFELDNQSLSFASHFCSSQGIDSQNEIIIGLNPGSGNRFLTKRWPEVNYCRLAEELVEKLGVKILLLGGPEEERLNKNIVNNSNVNLINSGTGNSLMQFAALIDLCDIVVTSDTLGMHLAIALKKHVIAIFGPTSWHEIDLYGRGVKLFPNIDCAPCYKSSCDSMACMGDMPVSKVAGCVSAFIEQNTNYGSKSHMIIGELKT